MKRHFLNIILLLFLITSCKLEIVETGISNIFFNEDNMIIEISRKNAFQQYDFGYLRYINIPRGFGFENCIEEWINDTDSKLYITIDLTEMPRLICSDLDGWPYSVGLYINEYADIIINFFGSTLLAKIRG